MHIAPARLQAATVLFLATALGTVGCGKSSPVPSAANGGAANTTTQAPGTTSVSSAVAARPPVQQKPVDPVVVLHTTQGDITIKLLPEKAPRTVENFLRGYAERGYYDQTVFHHVEPGVMLIGGGYTADLQRKPARAPIYNESKNGLSNSRGTIAMIRDPSAPHSATSEFFINLADNPDFNFKSTDEDDLPGYCVFGEVVSGMDVIDRIAQLPTTGQGDFTKVPSPQVAITGVKRLQ